jgi:hypothetical protein
VSVVDDLAVMGFAEVLPRLEQDLSILGRRSARTPELVP